jgi:hypothetical protein
MNNSNAKLLNDIKKNVREGLSDVLKNLGIDTLHPDSKEQHTEILLTGWQTVKDQFMKKWIPKLTNDEEEELVTWLKKEKSLHSIKDFVKYEYKEAIIKNLGIDKYIVSDIDPDVFDKIEELSFGANIAYNTILSMMNENLEILMADPYKDEAGIRVQAEDFWLDEVYGNMMIEYVQYGEEVVNELDEYAKSKRFFDGFINDMTHHIYNTLFEEKLNEIKKIREIFNIK